MGGQCCPRTCIVGNDNRYVAYQERSPRACFDKSLEDAGKEFSVHYYKDANHGFHNDTTPRYDEEAATLAWRRTMAFFGAYLSA